MPFVLYDANAFSLKIYRLRWTNTVAGAAVDASVFVNYCNAFSLLYGAAGTEIYASGAVFWTFSRFNGDTSLKWFYDLYGMCRATELTKSTVNALIFINLYCTFNPQMGYFFGISHFSKA